MDSYKADNGFELWHQRIQKVCNMLLEDNQFMSLPTVSVHNGQKCLFTFAFSASSLSNKINVTQKHYWIDSKHDMELCKREYLIDKSDLVNLRNNEYQRNYFDKLIKISDIVFEKEFDKNLFDNVKNFMDTINIMGTMLEIYKKENISFFNWLSKVNFI